MPAITTPPEIELLLYCVRPRIDSETTAQIQRMLQANIDWNYLIKTAIYHRVIPLLYQRLNTTYPQAIPESILIQLQHSYQANIERNWQLTGELLKLLDLFEKSQIPVIPFKGPVLAISAYGSLGFRQFHDIDILFNNKDILKARDLLISLGYENAENLTMEQEIAQLESPYVKAYTYKKKEPKVFLVVELHWKLRATYSSFPLDYEQLSKHLTPLSLAGKQIFSLSLHDQLLYLCAHGFGDRWKSLLLICDIAQLLHIHQQIDWQDLIKQARQLGCRRRLFLGLFLAQDLLGAELREEVCQTVQSEPSVKWLAQWVYQRLFRRTDEPDQLLAQALFDLTGLERWQDKIRYCIDRSILLIAKKYKLNLAKKYGLPGGK